MTSQFSTIQYCKDNTVPCFTFRMDETKKCTKKWKRTIKIDGFKDKTYYDKHIDLRDNAFTIITGHTHFVIDYDIKENPPQEIFDILYPLCEAVEKTPSGGYHFWFLMEDKLKPFKNNSKIFWDSVSTPGVDIRTLDGICYTSPTRYRKGGTLLHYKWDKGNLSTAAKIPDEILNHIDCNENKKNNQKTKSKKKNDDIDDSLSLALTDNPENIDQPSSDDTIAIILNALSPKRVDSYDDWIHVGMALKNAGKDCSIWEEWSKKSTKYTPGECPLKWDTFNKKSLTIKSLYYWLKEDNLEVFNSLLKQKKIKESESYDHEYAARHFVKLMGNHINRDGETVYYFSPTTGLWETGPTAFRSAVARHKHSLIFRAVAEGIEKLYNFGGHEKNVSLMEKWINTNLDDTNFLSKDLDSSYGKLLFKDGIYDFITDTFTEGFNPNIIFHRRINRTCPKRSERNEELIAKVEKMLFQDAFDDGDGKLAGLYLKKALCMGLIGDYERKKFFACLGESNCGKGLTTTAFCKAFEGYCDEWNANELKFNSRNGQDESRKLGWVKNLVGCRIAFSNEFRMDKTPIDGNLLKAITSGGDGIKARGHQEAETSFINRATMFLMANDFGNITPKDSGIQSRCRFIRYRLRFVPGNPTAPDERVADPDAKRNFNTTEYRDALFWIMVDTYQTMTYDEKRFGGVIKEPDCVKEETKEWVGDDGSGDFEDYIRKRYEVTGSIDDSVPSKDIVEYIINDCKMSGLSATKIGILLSKMIKKLNANCPRDRNPIGEEVGKQRLGIREK